jgi:hypothetical protein
MTQPAAPLNYASPMPKPLLMPGYLGPVVAIAVGVLGANGFADAAGFPAVVSAERDAGYIVIRVICGCIVAILTTAILASAQRLAQIIAGSLSHTRGRPVTAVVITMIAAGAVCLIAATVMPFHFIHNAPTSISMSSEGASSVSVGVSAPILSLIGMLIMIIVGALLVAVGIWGSLPARDSNV